MSEQSSNNQKSTVLAEIYSQQQSSAHLESRPGTVWQRMYAYFQQPRVIDQWLTGGILFFGIGGLLFGFLFFQYSLRAPHVRSVVGEKQQLSVEQKDQDLLGLRTKDTDGDGLTDYDEINIFGTSAYIADSDSDGLDDKLEITRGTDPLCAAGQNCFYNDLYAAQANEPVPISGQTSPAATLDGLRKALIAAGLPKATVDGMSDAELASLYQQAAVAGASAISGDGTIDMERIGEIVSPTVSAPVDNIDDLTPQQLREILMNAGVAAEVLEGISDAELLGLAQEVFVE